MAEKLNLKNKKGSKKKTTHAKAVNAMRAKDT